MTAHVHDLRSALKAYLGASTPREEQAAYHEILLFGGRDGFGGRGGYRVDWRSRVVRWLRCLAHKIDKSTG